MLFLVTHDKRIQHHTPKDCERNKPNEFRHESRCHAKEGVADVDRISDECIWTADGQFHGGLEAVVQVLLRPDAKKQAQKKKAYPKHPDAAIIFYFPTKTCKGNKKWHTGQFTPKTIYQMRSRHLNIPLSREDFPERYQDERS